MSVAKLIVPDFGADAAKEIMAQVGDVSWFKEFPTDVIVVKYIRKHIGSSGRLIAAPGTQTEDKYQGKVGLVVKLGSQAFVDSETVQFYGFKVEIGEWAVYKSSEGYDFDYIPPGTTDRVHCRIMKDGDIKGGVLQPELIW